KTINVNTYKKECINDIKEKTIKNEYMYDLAFEYIHITILDSDLNLSGIERYSIIPFVIATKRITPIIPLIHTSTPEYLGESWYSKN
ncbi:hypothetical protein E4178_RS24840, partial [Escherichia coli]